MINDIIEGICNALDSEFGDEYRIYTESVEQGLSEPCFFVFCINPTSRVFLGKRYLRTNQMSIQYIPKDTGKKQTDCGEVADRLFSCLEYITVTGELIRGTKMHSEINDGVLSFFVNYDLFTVDTKKTDEMNEISSDVTVKG